MKKKLALRRKILLSLVVFVGVAGWIEVTLRVLGVQDIVPTPPMVARTIDRDIEFPFMTPDPLVFWRLEPGFRGNFLGKDVTINSLGVRGPEIRDPPPGSPGRILCFGDSITFGYGVGDRQTYAWFLERDLGPDRVEVVNCGVTGYTSFQIARRLPQLCDKIDCQVALVCVGWNDASVRPIEDVQYAKQVRFAMTGRAMSHYCYIYRLIRNSYVDSHYAQEVYHSKTTRVPLDQYRHNLRSLVSECGSRGITPVFIDLPGRKKTEPPFAHPYSAALRTTCAELNVPLLDIGVLSSEFSQESNEEYFIDVCHFSVEGHRYLAARLADTLIGLGLVENASSPE